MRPPILKLPDGLPPPDWCDEKYDVALYCGDCMDVLPKLPTGYIDLVLTDPPYGIDGGRGGDSIKRGKGKYQLSSWQDTEIYIRKIITNLFIPLVAENQRMIINTGKRYMHLYPTPKDIGCFWNPAACGHGRWGFNSMSPILYYGKDPRAGKSQLPSGLQVTEKPSDNNHPCAKPIKAWTWLLYKGSLGGELVFDPFMGSGTTGVACVNLGRSFIGIEIERKYFDRSVERIRKAIIDKQNGPLFAEHKPPQLEVFNETNYSIE